MEAKSDSFKKVDHYIEVQEPKWSERRELKSLVVMPRP
jgi:hypothetical protein